MISASLRAIGVSALRTLLAFFLLISLLPAVSMVRIAAAENTNAAMNTNAEASAEADANANAAVSAETEAETKALGEAVGGFWKTAWNKSWPFIKGIVVKSWDATVRILKVIGAAFKEIGGSVKVDANANLSGVELVNVNGAIEVR